MPPYASEISYYLAMHRQGESANAFHGLLEMSRDALPELIQFCRGERTLAARELLVEVIWQYRDPSVIPFLGELLHDAEPRIWRQALDGLVALASPAALDAMRSAHSRQFARQREAAEFRDWLDDAIEQAEAVVKRPSPEPR